MNRFLSLLLAVAFIFVAQVSFVFAKSRSLQAIEGDRVVVLKVDKKAQLPKRYLRGKDAWKYIGTLEDLKKKVTASPYTGENVIRHAKSPRFQNLRDAIIFNTGGGKIGYAHRDDGAFTVIIDYPEGRKLKDLGEDLFDDYTNVIDDDCTVPYVFFDQKGEEAAIVFMPTSMTVYQYVTTDSLIAIEATERI
jgi:hypothetical protein